MKSLLVDFDNIIEPNNLPRLKHKIKPVPKCKNYNLGILITICDEHFQILSSIPIGQNRVNYLDNIASDIKHHTYIVYNKKQKICELHNADEKYLSTDLEGILEGLPNDVLIWISFPINKNINQYIKHNFKNAYISNISPLGYPYNNDYLCLSKLNNIKTYNATNEIKYVLKQYSKNNCSVKIKFTNDTIKYLKKLSKIGSTINKNGTISQKEIAGRFKNINTSKNHICTLEIDHNSIITGEEEGVHMVGGIYNFHTHPKQAYERNNVKLGWPSCQDYIGFLAASRVYNTIFHTVVSLEGLYFISHNKKTLNQNKNKKDIKKFVMQNFNIKYQNGKTVNWYLNKVNNLMFKNIHIFTVKYLSWRDADKIIEFCYDKRGKTCIFKDSTNNVHKIIPKH
jgi:hypothetical protein